MSAIQQVLASIGSSVAGNPGVLKGANYAVDISSSTATLNVPAGAASGDYLVAFLLCRGDRSFTMPGGWTLVATSIGGTSGTVNRYFYQKAWASETSVSFTQSTAAAFGYCLALVSAPLGVNQLISGGSATISKVSAATDLLSFCNFLSGSAVPGAASSYTLQGTTSFNNAGTYFYAGTLSTRTGVSAGITVAATGLGSVTDAFSFIAEIGS